MESMKHRNWHHSFRFHRHRGCYSDIYDAVVAVVFVDVCVVVFVDVFVVVFVDVFAVVVVFVFVFVFVAKPSRCGRWRDLPGDAWGDDRGDSD